VRRKGRGDRALQVKQAAAKLIPIPADFDRSNLGPIEGEIWIDFDLAPAEPLFFAICQG
jgi:hypothetical protein